MDAQVRTQVERLHASPTMTVVAVAGAGAQALSWLLGAPGASRTVLEALAPYASSALTELLGYAPRQVVARETAEDMARSAYQIARRLAPDGAPLVGIGCTATIATERPKKGEHRCFTSAWTEQQVTTYALKFVKGLRDREDDIVSRLLLRALAQASHVEFDLPLGLDDREGIEVTTSGHGDPVERLLKGQVTTVTVHTDGIVLTDEPVRGGVLPGSFDPLHVGHEELVKVAASMLEADVTFELSVSNVDKPLLEQTEVRKRLGQFAGRWDVVLTRAATFHEKAGLFPGCTFIVGWDTALRLVEPKYYGGDESEMLRALAEIRQRGCRFLVAGRVDDGAFHALEDVPVPAPFKDMFSPIPEAVYRRDLSSTQLRVAVRRPS